MLLAMLLLSAGPQVDEKRSAFDFSRSYSAWTSVVDGACIFFVTDAGLDARQLREELSDYDKQAGIEILTSDDTPARCISKARSAVRKAGFQHVRVRPGTDADRSPGIP